MIRNFLHRGLRRLYERGDGGRLLPQDVERIRRILARLDVSSSPGNMSIPGFHLHQLRGNLRGFWAVTVRANWRVIFKFEEGEAADVDFLDYH